jgi:hypothetical protein
MAEIRVKVSSQLESLPARLRHALDVAHEQSARETVNELRNEIINAGAIASFAGLRSIEKQFEDRGAIKAWLVGSELPYAPYAFEFGRKPGKQPPVEAILKWLAFKGIDGDRRTAFIIARSIGRKGVKPRFIFSRTAAKIAPRVQEIFEQRVGAEIKD